MIHTIEETITRLRQIQLDSDHPPREIVHMILAGGVLQSIYNVPLGIHESALEFLCRQTGDIRNYPLKGGVIHRDERGPYFSKGIPQFQGNQHPNEFLGLLAAAGVTFKSTRVLTDRGSEATLADMAERAMEIYEPAIQMHAESEPGWSLMLFSVYPGVDVEWKNEKNRTCSVEMILKTACSWPYGAGSCFGTHLLAGIAFAVSRYCMEKDLEPAQLEGVWQQGWLYAERAIQLMRRNQRDDGTIPRCWYKEKAYPRSFRELRELAKDLASRRLAPGKAVVEPTGHCLDALSPLAMFLAEDREWIDSASYILAQTVEQRWLEVCRDITALTHAVHALKSFMD